MLASNAHAVRFVLLYANGSYAECFMNGRDLLDLDLREQRRQFKAVGEEVEL
jgi:hypothetical protein